MEGGIRDSATLPGTSNINVWAKISKFHHGKDYEEFKFINVQRATSIVELFGSSSSESSSPLES